MLSGIVERVLNSIVQYRNEICLKFDNEKIKLITKKNLRWLVRSSSLKSKKTVKHILSFELLKTQSETSFHKKSVYDFMN